MTLDLSRVPHLEARKRLGDLLDERQAIVDQHEKELEAKTAALDAEEAALLEKINVAYANDYGGDVRLCRATGLVVFESDDLMRDDATGVVCLRALLPEAVTEKLDTLVTDDDDGDEFEDTEG